MGTLILHASAIINQSSADLRYYLHKNLGELAKIKDFSTIDLAGIADALHGDVKKIWLQAVFEEILYADQICGIPLEYPQRIFDEFTPFDIPELELAEILHSKCAFARIPLDDSANNGAPSFAHLWLVEGLSSIVPDHKMFLDHSAIIPKELKLFVSRSSDHGMEHISGESWQLAAKLAEKALREPKYKKEFASFIVSGKITDNAIERVTLENKLELDFNKWLIPRENLVQMSEESKKDKIIKTAVSVNDAWAHITGESTHWRGKDVWPGKIDEMHVLVGGSIKAQFMPVLLTKMKKVVLWTTDSVSSSIEPAKKLKDAIKMMCPQINVEISALQLSSKNIQDTEYALKDYFDYNKVHLKIFFNVTSGTKLMGFAAQTIARLFPNVELIYRDYTTSESGSFVHLTYDEFPPYSGLLIADEKVKKAYNWNFLNKNDKEDTYEDANEFIDKVTRIKYGCDAT